MVRLSGVKQLVLDWSSSNWYFLDEEREAIYLCHEELSQLSCVDLVSVRLRTPISLALDPVEGESYTQTIQLIIGMLKLATGVYNEVIVSRPVYSD